MMEIKFIFFPPLPFCSLGLHLLFEAEEEEEGETHFFGHTHTSALPAALTFLPVCVRNIHQITEQTHFSLYAAHLFFPSTRH